MRSTIFACLALSMKSYAAYPTAVEFRSACDLHTPLASNTSNEVLISRGSLPQKVQAEWLHASESDIMEWYKKGQAECKAFLSSNASSLGGSYPPPYQEKSEIKYDEQTKCRGRDMLYSLTGALVWPFGPYENCSTYTRCWFGLLTCGEPKMDSLASLGRTTILESLHQSQPQAEVPPMSSWSIRALVIHLRIVGLEIIVPEQRYMSLATGTPGPNTDVIIAQYVITLPYKNYKLEMRHVELYPSALYQWSTKDIDLHGMETPGNIYLGGSETRCSAGVCRHGSTCCGCDEKSYITGTPVTINALSGIEKCPNILNLRGSSEKHHKKAGSARGADVKSDEPSHLPLCEAGGGSLPGRWIMSSHSRLEHLSDSAPACPKNITSTAFDQVPKGTKAAHDNSSKSSHRHHTGSWFEASGDPCIVQNKEAEEIGEKSWFYAPYECRYHFYKKQELQHCMNVQNITHIHFHGDSMSRDLFVYVANYLGVPTVTEAELKHLTNDLNQKHTFTNSDGVLLSEGYTWEYDHEVMDLITTPPYPQVVITNTALAHSVDNFIKFANRFSSNEGQYWKNFNSTENHSKLQSYYPKHLIYQNTRSLAGKRNLQWHWSSHNFRRGSTYIGKELHAYGFKELDEYTLTEGRLDLGGDGFHFWGSMKQMEAVVFFNILCNHLHRPDEH